MTSLLGSGRMEFGHKQPLFIQMVWQTSASLKVPIWSSLYFDFPSWRRYTDVDAPCGFTWELASWQMFLD